MYALAIKKPKHAHTQDNKTSCYCFWCPDSEYVIFKIVHLSFWVLIKRIMKMNVFGLLIFLTLSDNVVADVLYHINVNIFEQFLIIVTFKTFVAINLYGVINCQFILTEDCRHLI